MCSSHTLLTPTVSVPSPCSNEALKVIKEQAKQQQWAADKAIMAEWAAQQERHEAARKAQVRGVRHAHIVVFGLAAPGLLCLQRCHSVVCG